jgi:hypothetical protein
MPLQIDRIDDIVIFSLMFFMAVIFAAFGQWEIAGNLASGVAGAGAMYLKGQAK